MNKIEQYEKFVNVENWTRCKNCRQTFYIDEIDDSMVCPNCGAYFRMSARKRLNWLVDGGTYKELDAEKTVVSTEAQLPGYLAKVQFIKKKTNENEAVLTGLASIGGEKVAIGIMDPYFLMGTLSVVVGEKLINLISIAKKLKLPLVIFTASGGARMQEGLSALLQMGTINNALNEFKKDGIYVAVMTDPTMGGTTASFASIADIQIAEAGAQIGFAGPRVIQNVTKLKELPTNFQSAETMLKNGLLDIILDRQIMKGTLSQLLRMIRKPQR
ncbi:acetyl-CoA carboxylase carboxyl transferase subunit beta [Lactiplantibacillus plantarum]|uniref:acetyl-CoA carboxylase carboxyltransferase subunit beta n=1 Tax=Lactiplantibacillus plantarum TaxID=1590 RepID=UPI00156D8B11|nr:acetyl-CoA carboxylase carboxyltransferase subunit beta [Lactiplantibacillus plantarum]MBY7656487.1 acetyl-CoA carboxylase carboxyl transferase subunit beta [Lactiplantibacillus plantarum]QKK58461.1 acetyl-CoA carboxylase carboxyl transferase subunit beta [Lactiplantibacillus plantarum]QSE52162.1 acetyl-CoA carboxylase carboxyl transferase subunit beta [Lactiplantibacillus plantarum]